MKIKRLTISIILLLGMMVAFFYLFSKPTLGGGGSEQFAPDVANSDFPITVGIIASVWGDGGTISGRFTNLSLHYKLTNEPTYRTIAATRIPLPEKYKKSTTPTNQWEAYEFNIPPYPKGTIGEIEYGAVLAN